MEKHGPGVELSSSALESFGGDSMAIFIKFERLLLPRQLRWEKLRSTDADRQAHFCQDTEVGEYRHKHAVGCQFSL